MFGKHLYLTVNKIFYFIILISIAYKIYFSKVNQSALIKNVIFINATLQKCVALFVIYRGPVKT